MACTGYKTVRITHLDHHNAVIGVGCKKDLCCFLFCHSLLLTKFNQLVNISGCLIGLSRIYDLCSCDIAILLIGSDFFLRTDDNDFGKSLFQDLFCCLVSADILGLRKYDCLNVLFCACFNLIYEAHTCISFQRKLFYVCTTIIIHLKKYPNNSLCGRII